MEFFRRLLGSGMRGIFGPQEKPAGKREETVETGMAKSPEFETDTFCTLLKYSGEKENVIVPKGIVKIGAGAFRDNQRIRTVTLPTSLREICANAFSGSSLEEITIPEGVSEIGYNAFRSCKKLREVQLPESLLSIGNGAFSGCGAMTELKLPSSLRTLPQDEYGEVFAGAAIRQLVIPDRVTLIEDSFNNMPALEAVYLPDSVTSMKNAFRNCTALREIRFSENLRELGNNVFGGCVSLEEVQLPDGLLEIGDGAFSGCKALNQAVLPNSLVSMGPSAFSRTAFAEANDIKALAEMVNTKRPLDRPAAYSPLSFNGMEFYYRKEMRHGKHYERGTLQLDRRITSSMSVYRNEKNEEILRLYMSIPTFDSGDREWDSYRELCITSKAGRLLATLIAGGYRVASASTYSDLRPADSRTEKLLEAAGFLL